MRVRRKRGKTASATGQQESSTQILRRAQLPKTEAAHANQYATKISEALLISGLHQHELTEVAENLNRQLQAEIVVRTETEKALRESEEQFRVMADNIAPMAWMANADGWIFFYNKRWYDYTGTSLEEMQGWGWEKVHHPDHLSRVKKIWTAHLRDGTQWEDTFPLRDKDGKYRWFLSGAFPIRDSAGTISRWFGTNTDVTEHKRAEEEILRLNADLEHRVIERTAQLHAANVELLTEVAKRQKGQVALHDKNIELQGAAEVKDLFLANMSHELRTPLNGIIGFAEFLVDGKPGAVNPKQKEYLEDILNSGKHLHQLISDILDLAKVGAGKMEFYPEKFSLRKAIHETCAASDPIAQKRGIQINVAVAPEIGDVTLDQKKFKQVLFNLLSNAIKFNDDGGKVGISVEPYDTDCVKLVVSDTGIGIKAEDVGRLFNAFEQLESGASRRHEGTGLGLALTRKIVELQGGNISVESQLGKGSNFIVVLPLVHNQGQPTVLVVDDDPDVQEFFKSFLKKFGFSQVIVGTAKDAIASLRKQKFDLMFLDLQLPDAPGDQVYKTAKQIDPDLNVIVITGYPYSEMLDRILQISPVTVLKKPLKIEQLNQTVKILGHSTARVEP